MHRTVYKLATSLSKTYKRRCWWAEEDDLYQEAAAAMLKAAKTFDPNFGSQPEAYLYTAGKRAVTSLLWRASAPVSAGSGAANLPELQGLHRAPVDTERVREIADEHDLERQLEEQEWLNMACEMVRERLRAASPDGLAEAVLLDGQKPKDVAAARQVPVQKVYGAAARARALVGNSLDLWRLWRKER